MKNIDVDEFISEIENVMGDEFDSFVEAMKEIVRIRIANRGDIKDMLIYELAIKGGLKEEMDKLLRKFFTSEELREIATQGIDSFSKRIK